MAGYDLIVKLRNDRGADAGKSNLRELAAVALVAKGNSLAGTGHHEEAIGAFQEVLVRFGNVQELVVRKQLAMAMLAKGNC